MENQRYDREGLKTALKSVIIDLAINPDKMIEEEEFHELATLLQNAETALYAHTHFAWKDETEPF